MSEALCSILCEPDYLKWEPGLLYDIRFREDGTGELLCIQELTYLFAVNFEWRLVGLRAATTEPTSVRNTKPQPLGSLDIDITLKRGLADGLHTHRASKCLQIQERYLSDKAYRTKSFTLTIEQGNFLPASRKRHEDKKYKYRYGLRLLFDKSPFPPREEWNNEFPNEVPPIGPMDRSQPPMVEFVARALPKSEHSRTVMNDTTLADTWWSCAVS